MSAAGYAVPLPPGADPKHADAWEVVNGVPVRLVWSHPLLPAGAGVDVRVVCTQAGDGHVLTEEPPEVYWDDEAGHSPAVARQVAEAILEACDLADRWASRQLRLVT